MADLFTREGAGAPEGPLADRMRPRSLDEVAGQDRIVGPGRLLRRAIQADRLSSLIFYGPPGTGKTSLARVIAHTTKAHFESLNAVLSGIKDIREAIDRADERRRLYGRRTILFVDEVHRWNKAQQDALLPWVENGTVILVGATTENPFFEVNRALVSRSRIFQLKALDAADLMLTARRAVEDRERGYGKWRILFGEGALEHLVEVASGDARSLLNALELAVETSPWTVPAPAGGPGGDSPPGGGVTGAAPPLEGVAENPKGSEPGGGLPPSPASRSSWPPPPGAEIAVTLAAAEESIQRRAVLYDRDGDYHYDTISAFIKSVRGSDPDAALYWLAKMLRAGEDPAFVFRRMIILASEDVGMADPHALAVVISCAEAFDRIGFPEGNFPLAQACIYLATAPKSNSAMAFFDALAQVDREDAEVPNHLRDASRDAEGFGHGAGYIYPHAYREHWAAQQYLPLSLRGKTFYSPSEKGYEGKIREEVTRKREIQAAVILQDAERDAGGELLSWQADAKGREGWWKRLESGRSALLLLDRDRILDRAGIGRQDRVLVSRAGDGLLLWESLRRAPEGLSAALTGTEEEKAALLRLAEVLDEAGRPIIAVREGLPLPAEAGEAFGTEKFDALVSREPWRRGFGGASPEAAFRDFAGRAFALLEGGAPCVILQSPPRLGERLSRLLRDECGTAAETVRALEAAEESFYQASAGAGTWWAWDTALLEGCFSAAGFALKTEILDREEERPVTEKDLDLWFDAKKSSWGRQVHEALGDAAFTAARAALAERTRQGPLPWKWQSLLVSARRNR